MNKRWKLTPADNALAATLANELAILPLTAQFLINRGLADAGAAALFLRPTLADLPDPFLMNDMDKVVERVAAAVSGREKIAVWGDYDVDGATATALLYLFFRELGADCVTYIPGRHTEGYGLNTEGLQRLKESGVSLVITVDCGSSNHEEVAFANSIGLDVVITDHHEMPHPVPDAYAVLNPKRPDCAYPFKGLAGVGVAFCLALALRARLREAGWFTGPVPNLKRYLDLVCIGTVADVVPLVGVNRVLVSTGLAELAQTARPGLKALMDVSRLRPGALGAEAVAFRLAPRLNAAGRLESAGAALRLLITHDVSEAAALAHKLDAANLERQKIEDEILKEALLMLGASDHDKAKGVVLASEGWNVGVIGIVASRLVERLHRPVVMIALEGGLGKGSARGIRSFDLIEGLRACGHLLTRFGGHKAAAGLSLTRQNLALFKEEFLRYADAAIPIEALVPEIRIDASVTLSDVSERLASETAALAPFGSGNHEPLLCLTGADIVSTEVVKEKHLRFRIRQGGAPGACSGIGFGLAALHPMHGPGYVIACAPYMDEWQGMRSVKLRIRDVRPQEPA